MTMPIIEIIKRFSFPSTAGFTNKIASLLFDISSNCRISKLVGLARQKPGLQPGLPICQKPVKSWTLQILGMEWGMDFCNFDHIGIICQYSVASQKRRNSIQINNILNNNTI